MNPSERTPITLALAVTLATVAVVGLGLDSAIPQRPGYVPSDAGFLPDPARTPGVADPSKTKEVLCAPGYTTKAVRPKSAYTTKLKKQQMAAWGLQGSPADYEEDHLVSLELGGDPVNPQNLWPQRWKPAPGAREKDKVENWLHKEVCQGKVPLSIAQVAIATNWYEVYKRCCAK